MAMMIDDCCIKINVTADLDFLEPPKNKEEEFMRQQAQEVVRFLAHKIQPTVAELVKTMVDIKSGR